MWRKIPRYGNKKRKQSTKIDGRCKSENEKEGSYTFYLIYDIFE